MSSFDLPVRIWWLSLCCAAALNATLWVLSARLYRKRVASDPTYAGRRRWHLILSGVYVVVCGFRGILPRADVQRICLFDTWLSSIAVGRTVATIAELACAIQWALLLAEIGRSANLPNITRISRVIVPLIAFAEVCSWYAVLSTNYLGNTIEESSWTLMAAILGFTMASLRPALPKLKPYLMLGVVGCAFYVLFMITVDVHMYFTRWRADEAAGRAYMAVADGFHDIATRWVVTGAWSEWHTEIAWMTLYFTAAVWVMTSLTHAPQMTRGHEPSDRASAP